MHRDHRLLHRQGRPRRTDLEILGAGVSRRSAAVAADLESGFRTRAQGCLTYPTLNFLGGAISCTSGSRIWFRGGGGQSKNFLGGHFFIAENAFSGQKKRSKIFKIFMNFLQKFCNNFCVFSSVSICCRSRSFRGGGGRSPPT